MQNNDKNLSTSIQVIELDDDALESVAGGVNVACANYDCPEDVKIDIDADFPSPSGH